jgi:hypothetical protein
MPVLDLAGVAVDDHQAGIFPFLCRVLCDEVERKVESELGKLHGWVFFIEPDETNPWGTVGNDRKMQT